MSSGFDGAPAIVELKFSAAAWIFAGVTTLGCGAGAAACIIGFVAGGDPPLAVFGAILLVATLFFAWLTGWCVMRRVRLYEWGLVSRGLFAESQLRFEEIETVALPAVSQIGVEPIGRAVFRGGQTKVGLGGFPIQPSTEVGNFVIARVVTRLADQLESRMRGGEEIKLGAARVSSNGVTAQGRTIAWHEIERANFSPEGLRVFPKGRPEGTIVLPQGTPNLHVIVELAARMIERADRGAGTSMQGGAAPNAIPGGGGERVSGFDEHDPELGVLVCGRGRAGVSKIVLALLTLGCGAGAAFPMPMEPRIGLVIAAIVFALIALGLSTMGFAVYERGVRGVKKRVAFADVEHVTYHVVDQYQNGVYSGRNVSLTLESPGAKISFNGMGAKNEGICTAVLDRAMEPVLERKWRDLQAGGEVKVDKLVVKSGSLSLRKEEIPLSMVTGVEPRQGFLHIWKSGKETSWAVINLGVRDARLLLPLLERMLAAKSAGAVR